MLALLPIPDVAWMVAALLILSGPTVGSLAAPAGAMLSDAASALGIGQVIAVALSNVAWSAARWRAPRAAAGWPR